MGEIMKRGKNTSVKWKMVSMILLYWALPFALMLALVGHIMADRQEKTGLERMAAQLEMDNGSTVPSAIRARLHMTKYCTVTTMNSAKAA